MMFLEQELNALEAYLPDKDTVNESVSSVSVGRHIEHSLLAVQEIMRQCLDSDPAQYQWRFNLVRYIVLWSGIIPRGKAKAPDFTLPKQEITHESLVKHFEDVRTLRVSFDALTDSCKRCMHPFFGMLNLAESKRNCVVHTRHHCKIIKDIVGK